jgi:hypothetical protein
VWLNLAGAFQARAASAQDSESDGGDGNEDGLFGTSGMERISLLPLVAVLLT